jgi:hypothetical protein
MVAVRIEPEPLRNCLLFMSHAQFGGSLVSNFGTERAATPVAGQAFIGI